MNRKESEHISIKELDEFEEKNKWIIQKQKYEVIIVLTYFLLISLFFIFHWLLNKKMNENMESIKMTECRINQMERYYFFLNR